MPSVRASLRRVSFPLLAIALLVFAGLAQAAGQLVEVSGEVSVSSGTRPTLPAQKGQVVENGSVLLTGGKSRAVLRFPDGQVIALKSDTSFQINDYRYEENNPSASMSVLSLLKGGLRVVSGLLARQRPEAFSLTAATATIGIRGTEFLLEIVNPLYVHTISGTVSATNMTGSALFGAGQYGVVSSATSLPVAVSAGQLPAGVFGELMAIPMPPPTPGPLVPPPTPVAAVISPAAAAAAAAAAGVLSAAGGGDSTSSHATPSHH